MFAAETSLVPLAVVREEPSDFAECVPDFLVEDSQGVCMKVSWDHPHIVRNFTNPGTISEQS